MPGVSLTTGAPVSGVSANVPLAVKDFESQGIIFVYSQEIIDNMKNVTGSKITYEMLMKEAKKLDADDIINVRVDVKRTINVDHVVFDYTGIALAIKYTTSKDVPGEQHYESMTASLPEATMVPAGGGNRNTARAVLWGLLGVVSLITLIGILSS
jgi:hypothetical protein